MLVARLFPGPRAIFNGSMGDLREIVGRMMSMGSQADNSPQPVSDSVRHDQAADHVTLISRQPVFDADKVVWGYELLGASNSRSGAAETDQTLTTRRVIHDAVNVIGLESLLDGKRMLIH